MPVPSRAVIVRAAAVAMSFTLTFGASLWAAAAGRGWLLVVATGATVAVELTVRLRAIDIAQLLARAGAGLPTRAALGVIALVLLAGRELRHSVAVGTAIAGVLIVVGTAGFVGLRRVVERLARPPLMTRNLALDVPLPPTPPRLLSDPPGPGVIAIVVAAIGLAVDCGTGATTAAAVGLAIATALALLPVAVLAGHAVRVLAGGARSAAGEAAARAVERLAPQVVVYFASTPREVYQVNQWLEVVERLDRPAMVLVRSHEVMTALAPTSLPIACSPYNGTIASLVLPEPVVTLFPTHSGNNLSMIRRPETRTVFVSHGDSDKPDSINPFARVYDEVWVAGPLGRRRYAEASVGVADASIVEIGRPQIRPPSGPPPQPPVVVYAPTWEGWGDDPHHSSLAQIGPALIRALTARPGVEVRYRPHPLTGVRSPELRAADREIASLVGRVAAEESLSETFASAAAVIADVSSVVPEFLPYDRPYAVADTRGLGSAEFIARFPSAAAGFVLDTDLGGLDAFLAAATGGADPTAADRRVLMRDALGDPATSQQRFAAAVDRLLSR